VPDIQAEGKTIKICGIWSKNRWEWLSTQIASWFMNSCVTGFYDSMNDSAIKYIIDQTQMTIIFCEGKYVQRLIDMKKAGKAETIVDIVNYDDSLELKDEAAAAGINLYSYSGMTNEGNTIDTELNNLPGPEDLVLMSFTSGTTGDAKGVKLTHRNLMMDVESFEECIPLSRETTMISYLPYPHVFEQALMGAILMKGGRIGYFNGNPLLLTQDCSVLKPTVFPSVPRLYNKIYAKIKSQFDEFTGCKAFLVNTALASKTNNLLANAEYTHGCYDYLVFKKIKALLGGRVEFMVTGSAPIDREVLAFLKVCFACPILEGYGLSETSAAATASHRDDPNLGHVGGPVRCTKLRLKDVPEMNYFATDLPYPRGEIQMKGANVFPGYFKKPEITAEAFDAQGWFCSGDVGVAYPNGSVAVIDRAKQIFKLS